MDIETWIAKAVAALTGKAGDAPNTEERARDTISTARKRARATAQPPWLRMAHQLCDSAPSCSAPRTSIAYT